MNASRPVPVAKWMTHRARLLHGICLFIQGGRANGLSAGRAYNQGRARFNRSLLATRRNRRMSLSGIRAIYATWRATGKSIECFAPKWKTPVMRKITAAQARRWGRRIIAQSLTVSELYRRLKAEKGTLLFCDDTLRRALPSPALRALRSARMALERAERFALDQIEARCQGAA
jgi:hypothetical protein